MEVPTFTTMRMIPLTLSHFLCFVVSGQHGIHHRLSLIHIYHHKDMQEYIDAKRNILLYQKQPCCAVLEMCIRDRCRGVLSPMEDV